MGVNKIYNVYKGLKKVFSKTDDTITGMKPKGGKTDTNQYLLKKGIQDVKKKTEELRKATKKGDK